MLAIYPLQIHSGKYDLPACVPNAASASLTMPEPTRLYADDNLAGWLTSSRVLIILGNIQQRYRVSL